ncbi:MAG TPA: protein-disulfide reductase DsbD family protein [Bacteroidales bacterium]|nr:protein-disulfide reductase DsbD family protein [Bacteroidales bacterium]HPS15592.1 protein-disulfide reductase DsbD family protein [Bacteroidales bacterium]
MRKRNIILFVFMLIGSIGFSQVFEPVKWSFSSQKTSDSTANLYFKATIENGWHLYSQKTYTDGGPVPIQFTFANSKDYKLNGKMYEPKPIEEYDEGFEFNVYFFKNTVTFVQKINITTDKTFDIKGEIVFEACSTSCVFPTQEFVIKNIAGYQKAKPVKEDTVAIEKTDTVPKVEKDTASAPAAITDDDSDVTGKNKSLWWFFVFAFVGGLAAIIMPCVFPMIPMTVAYFMKSGSKGKIQAFVYGLSIIVIYTLFGTLIALIFGVDFSNWLATHWLPNILFFLIFVIFAISMFGYFEITMPNWMVNKSVAQEDRGGYVGIIFMALTLVLVSFSCTGPIVGWIIVASAGGQFLKPIIGMLGFSLAFALPFTMFALFPRWLQKMPKSGGWLNMVKVILAFIELAFALKFLNVPDQTYHWRYLDREVYLAFWIVIGTLLGMYLLGKIKFPHDSDYPVMKSFPRLLSAIFVFAFVVYMIPGLWGAPLKALSGWLPPMETQDFDISRIVRENTCAGEVTSSDLPEVPKYADKMEKLPLGLKGYYDYDQALKVAKKLNKPVFVDFTGHGCTNCREMENRVWSDPEVLKRLREKFVVVALYVDDKVIELPENEWYTNDAGIQVKLLGKKNSEIQLNKYQANAQPFYVLLDTNDSMLVKPKAYDLDIEGYIKFLDSGLKEFEKRSTQKK